MTYRMIAALVTLALAMPASAQILRHKISFSHATDCTTNITNGKALQLCVDLDDGALWRCEPSAGDCDTAGEWKVVNYLSTTVPAANGGTGLDTSASTGVMRTSSGTWSADADISHLASSTSANLAGVLSDETGSGAAVFGTTPTIAGSTLTGAHDAGGADSFEIPNGANPTVNAAGEIAIDTTNDQLVHGASGLPMAMETKSVCGVVENLAAADDNFPFPVRAGQTIVLISAFCHCQGTCTTEADLSFEYVEVGTGGPTVTDVTGSVTCEDYVTGDSATTLSGNTTVTALDVLRFDVDNAVSPETDEYSICVNYRLGRT